MILEHGSARLSGLTLFILSFLSAITWGCGDNSAMLNAVQTLRTAAFGTPDAEISRERLATIPYAMITARAGKLPRAVLVLGSDNGDFQQWFSTNEISIVTQDGRLVQTVGLERDIRESQRFGIDPLSTRPHQLHDTVSFNWQVAGWKTGQAISFLQCKIVTEGPEQILIAELHFDTQRLRETCRDEAGDKFENLYWVDIFDGFVWKSRQRAGRDGPVIEIEVLKPPAVTG